jgi:hypothetical protein
MKRWKKKQQNTIGQDILVSIVKQEQLVFEHNKNKLYFLILMSFPTDQLLHKGFYKNFIDGVNK